MYEWWLYPLAIFGGLLAGVINTLAGSGSAVTLPLLVFLGLDANMANGTNRVGIIFQSLIAVRKFKTSGNLQTKGIAWLVVPAVIGAVIGALAATELNEESMNFALGVLMVFLLFLVLANPKKWLAEAMPDPSKLKSPRNVFLMFLVGIHGGFVQAGVGIMLLAVLVLGAGYSLVRANGVKLVIVFCFAVPALLLFAWNGQVNWFWGCLVAIGQSIGGWVGATFAVGYPQANVWIRRLLIVVILMAMVKFFGLYRLL